MRMLKGISRLFFLNADLNFAAYHRGISLARTPAAAAQKREAFFGCR